MVKERRGGGSAGVRPFEDEGTDGDVWVLLYHLMVGDEDEVSSIHCARPGGAKRIRRARSVGDTASIFVNSAPSYQCIFVARGDDR